jgi:arginyl-tRNA synthetase
VLPHKQIELKLQAAVHAVLRDADVAAVLVRPCPDPKFGDYQSNALMALAKARKMNPRQLATDVIAKLEVSEICEKVEIAGAGFLNFRLKNSAITQTLEAAARGEHLFFEAVGQASSPSPSQGKTKFETAKMPVLRTVVIDFSAPNVAKPMHVGHIRSTILGDCLARTLRLLGHRVVTDNHIGDWGTQFGMLLLGWKQHLKPDAVKTDPIGEMERLYKMVSATSEKMETVRDAAKQELVKLQSGDAENLKIWREMIALSEKQFDQIYSRLGVKFDHTLGESFYNPRLKPLVDELVAKGLARESEGALAIFFDGDPQLKDKPALVRKSDGGFNYTTTDLATLAYRLETWHPDEIVYVTDGRQQLHFQQVFTAFRKWMERRASARLDSETKQRAETVLAAPNLAHVWFGSILGEDGKPFKTRSGETVKLADLLDEAEERALRLATEKSPDLPESQRREIARVVGLGAVKYADLLPNRQSDYVFSWDKMLALQGNTAPYLQYAYARIRSIFRKAEGTSDAEHRTPNIELASPEEFALAKHLLNFGLTLEAVAEEYRPNFLCNYLYELAGKFTAFYENCPVLKADDSLRLSRLALCDLTAKVLKQGLDVLGIEVVEQM